MILTLGQKDIDFLFEKKKSEKSTVNMFLIETALNVSSLVVNP